MVHITPEPSEMEKPAIKPRIPKQHTSSAINLVWLALQQRWLVQVKGNSGIVQSGFYGLAKKMVSFSNTWFCNAETGSLMNLGFSLIALFRLFLGRQQSVFVLCGVHPGKYFLPQIQSRHYPIHSMPH